MYMGWYMLPPIVPMTIGGGMAILSLFELVTKEQSRRTTVALSATLLLFSAWIHKTWQKYPNWVRPNLVRKTNEWLADKKPGAKHCGTKWKKPKPVLVRAMTEAVKETKQTKGDLKSLVGGIAAGSGEVELKKVPLRDQIALAEEMTKNHQLKEIAEWAGRFKQIARKKQRSKHDESVDRSGVMLGNQVERLLPMELGMYSHPATKTDFLRRFAEGQTMVYEQKGKETLGKGPIVLCLDQSGSMSYLDTQAKGFALALMSIARKQRRDFALILFSGSTQTFRYPKGKISPEDMVTLAETFLSGGTCFDRPLKEALKVIGESRFHQADMVFVTDGEAYLQEHFVERFNAKKREKGFNVMSLLLGVENKETVEQFADEILTAHDFGDESSHVVFAI